MDGCIRTLKKSLSDNTIRRHYIKPLENAGFISYEQDPNNKVRKLVKVLKADVEETGKDEKHGSARFIGRINLDLKRIKSVEKFKKPLPLAYCDNCCLEKTQKRIITHRALTFTNEVLFLCGDCADLIIKAKKKEEIS